MILVGTSNIQNIYLGSQSVTAIYLGSELIWPLEDVSYGFVSDDNKQFITEDETKNIWYDEFATNIFSIITETEQNIVKENGYETIDYDGFCKLQPDEDTLFIDSNISNSEFAIWMDNKDSLIDIDK